RDQPVEVSVRRTRPLVIHYVLLTQISRCLIPGRCYGPIDLRAAGESFRQSRDFIEGTYPVPRVISRIVGTIEGSPIPLLGRERDLDQAWRVASSADPSVDRVVLLVPPGY